MAFGRDEIRPAFWRPAIDNFNEAGMAAYNAYNTRSAYDPRSVAMTQAGGEADQQRLAAQSAWQAQQQAAGTNTYAHVNALKAELQQNQAEISRLQAELAKINSTYGNQDNMDRMLAANRARIGDMGTSRSHQQDIQNRMQWRWQMDRLNNAVSTSQKKTEIKNLTRELDNAYSEFAWADSEEQKQVAQNKINRLSKEYQDLTGEEFENPFSVSVGVPKAGDTAKTLGTALGKLKASFDKNGRPTEAALEEFDKDITNLPFTPELADAYNERKKMISQETASDNNKKLIAKQKKALTEVTPETLDVTKLVDKDSYEATASNGQKYTVTKTKGYEDGTYDYIVKCGNQTKTIHR